VLILFGVIFVPPPGITPSDMCVAHNTNPDLPGMALNKAIYSCLNRPLAGPYCALGTRRPQGENIQSSKFVTQKRHADFNLWRIRNITLLIHSLPGNSAKHILRIAAI
jgi:hypothetical protein